MDTDALDEADLHAMKKSVTPTDVIGLLVGLVPFGFSYSSSSETTVSMTGIETRTTKHVDYVAIGCGAATLACAVVAIVMIGHLKNRALRFVVFAVLLALGGLQVVRGFLAPTGTSSSGIRFS